MNEFFASSLTYNNRNYAIIYCKACHFADETNLRQMSDPLNPLMRVHTSRFLKYVWPFYNIMHEMVK